MKNKAIFIIVASILFSLITVNIVLAQFSGGAPNPGDIYKEFTFNNNNNNWRVTDPNSRGCRVSAQPKTNIVN